MAQNEKSHGMDDADRRILQALEGDARYPTASIAERLGMSRRTVQQRIDRLGDQLLPNSVRIPAPLLGFPTRAYVMVSLTQGGLAETVTALATIDEIVSADAISGSADLICHVVARDNAHVYDVGQRILSAPNVIRTSTQIVLREHISPRMHQLIDADR